MRLVIRKLKPGETDWELTVGALFLPLFLLAASLLARFAGHVPVFCVLYRTTGIPCPACGSLRSLQHLLAGEFPAAWRLNPLAVALVAGGIVFAVYSWIVVAVRLPRLRLEGTSRTTRWLVTALVIATVAANWLYLLTRS